MASVMVFCAHNDDQVIGAGGTLAHYAKQGKEIYTVVFSFGETSHPHLQKKVTIKMRVEESKKANDVIGGKEIYHMGLREGKFQDEIKKKKVENKIIRMIAEKKPEKIFTHSSDDPHPDHRAIYKLVNKITGKIDYKGDVYTFEVWNPISIRKRNLPKLVVDISDTFKTKIRAFKVHKSQRLTLFLLILNIYIKAIINGLNNHVKYAEVFYKIR